MPLVFNLHGFGSNATRSGCAIPLATQFGDERGLHRRDAERQRQSRSNGLSGTSAQSTMSPLSASCSTSWRRAVHRRNARVCRRHVEWRGDLDVHRLRPARAHRGDRCSRATAGPRLCGSGTAIPIITFRGTDDACVPYEGGTSACGMRLPVVAAEEVIRLWGEHNGCDPVPANAQCQSTSVQRRTRMHGWRRRDSVHHRWRRSHVARRDRCAAAGRDNVRDRCDGADLGVLRGAPTIAR